MAQDGANADIFGVRVALSGDTALISARRADVDGMGKDAGAAYLFERTEGKWTQIQKLVAPDGKADDRFAHGVALNKDTAIISAMQHDAIANNAGALFEPEGQVLLFTSRPRSQKSRPDPEVW
ncbi:FG-GAP repeat protein [Rheinheimera baltica]|uniref:FG-GAP repeat protein n=1 Tax=Rheinheimera baltica TaxID=67576 RepID=A0ABT9I4P9_9GAMM|nr:FG-GAP repeat protein [Rheinheimera baltica]MDP5138381.1 FG-GAP repeat protein [Rheinheimera baltica]MDP5141507.1 FG-GAP repeat protein [Rheinheimera baltica]MDP5148743.1 FG-GAP repeat protein [Rheinheimera baltica]